MTPEQIRIAVRFPDSVAVMGFITKGSGSYLPSGAEWHDKAAGVWKREPTDASIFEEITRAFAVPPISYRVLKDGEIPEDRTYRSALRDDGKKLKHDMAHAKELHRERLRRARAYVLADLDIEYARADEAGNVAKKAEIVAKKQELRDITSHKDIESAKTVDDLRAATLGLL